MLPEGDRRARPWIDAAADEGDIFAGSLLGLELTRVLRREGLDLARARPVLDRIHEVSINDGVLRVAGTIEQHIKSLDAIHLATALLLGSGITLATHDGTMRDVGVRLGFEVVDPVGNGVAS